MKTILLDVDGVLLDTGKRIQEYLAKEHGVTENQDIFCWDWEYSLGVEWKDNEEFWKWFWSEPLEKYTGALEFVQACKEAGYRVNACSNRTYGSARDAAIRDFHEFGFDEIQVVDDPIEKQTWAVRWCAKYSLEDNPKNAWLLAQQVRYSLLLTRSWNIRCMDFRRPTWTRVDDYAHFLCEITGGY